MKSKALLNRLQKSELKLEKIVLLTVSLFVFFTMYYYENGADVFVAGSAVFKAPDAAEAIAGMRKVAQ